MSERDPRARLREAGIRPKKSFSQNFLVAAPIARAIARACVPDSEAGRARVVEIGAGTGALTALLAERARSVVAIERDRDLVPLLASDRARWPNVRVEHGDALIADLGALLGEREADSPRVLCGNLPYAITGRLLRRVVERSDGLERAVFMVQLEVAERLTASPGTKSWGALTVFVRAVFDVRRVLRAGPGAFHPPPKVASAVVELLPLKPARARVDPWFERLVRRAFGARRKTLRNAWAGLAPDARLLAEAAAKAGIDLEARGETLEVEAFARMAEALEEHLAPGSEPAEDPTDPPC